MKYPNEISNNTLKETENNAEETFIISPVYSLKIINNDRVIDIKNQLPNYS